MTLKNIHSRESSKKNASKKDTKKETNKKTRGRPDDSDSEEEVSEQEEEWETEEEDEDDEEDEDEDEEDDDEEETEEEEDRPRKRASSSKKTTLRKHGSKRATKYEEDETEDEDEDEKRPRKRASSSKKTMLRKRPSKYEEDSEDEETEDSNDAVIESFMRRKKLSLEPRSKSSKKPEKKSNKKPEKSSKKSSRCRIIDDSDEDDDDSDDEDYDDDDDEEEEMVSNKLPANLVIMLGGGNGEEDDGYYDSMNQMENEEIEQSLNFDNDECNSEDEKTFMRENYESIEYPKDATTTTKASNKRKSGGKKMPTKGKEEVEVPKIAVEDEYTELIELKRHISGKLQKNPHSKFLLKTMKECCDSINKLVKKTRTNNAKDYFNLIKTETKGTITEIDYFKKKLSNKEQKAIMDELKSINDQINIDKPYRLTLLQTNLPLKHKATVMQKLNVMRSMEPGESEYHKMKTWVDSFMRIPFNMYKNLTVRMSDGMDVCDRFMKNAKTQLDNCVYGLDDAKIQILQLIGQWITNPDAMGCAIAIHGPPGTGKCFAIDTPILMYDGSVKKVQDVLEGEVIMGDDSTPRNVLGLGRGEDAMYDIVYPNEEHYTVNSEHILSLKNEQGKVVDITVMEYLSLPEEEQRQWFGYRTGVEFAVAEDASPLPLLEIMTNYEIGASMMRDIETWPRIPREYLIRSRKARLEMLAGMIDNGGGGYYQDSAYSSDGSVEDVFYIAFSLDTESRRYTPQMKLLDDVKFLVKSLGLNCMVVTQHEEDVLEIYGKGLRTILPCSSSVTTTTTEVKPATAAYNARELMYPIQVRSIGRGRYYGFEIDGNRRFVLGDFTVTHNTSLAKEGISKILGREFAFMALGGAGDSSFLEGHSYTYEGSTWGRITQILIDSKCMNPVIYFDELDKLSDSSRGQEITGILTHLIDKSQNTQFHDKYFSEVDLDLSKCLFIFSYNDEELVNPILRDRMYRIKTKGYDSKEKMTIAKKYMLPKIREQVNFQEGDILIPDEVIQYIISNPKFTQNEQGVRNLGRCLEIIHTKLNLFRLMHVTEGDKSILGKDIDMKVTFPYTVTKKDVDILVHHDENQNQSMLAMYV